MLCVLRRSRDSEIEKEELQQLEEVRRQAVCDAHVPAQEPHGCHDVRVRHAIELHSNHTSICQRLHCVAK